ncbi:MAG: HDIG domain-containing protein [Methanomicrobiaceae archaeon]|nr:HDIG domain-containing protein [Methanomicrobiaceae archaeon]
MKLPDIDPISLLKKSGCPENVIEHCIAVRDLAMKFARNAPANRQLVETGALLHDIGRCRAHTIAHAQIGTDICREYGLPEEVCRIVQTHIGAGLSADECREKGLKPIDCIPKTIEEKIVAHADNLISGTKEISIEERLCRSADLPEEIRKRMKDLSDEIEKYR